MFKLTVEEMKKYRGYEYKYVCIRRNRKEYELYNELTSTYDCFNDIESAVERFNEWVEQNDFTLSNR